MCSRVAGCVDSLKAKDANTCGAFYLKEVKHFLCTSSEVLMSFRFHVLVRCFGCSRQPAALSYKRVKLSAQINLNFVFVKCLLFMFKSNNSFKLCETRVQLLYV